MVPKIYCSFSPSALRMWLSPQLLHGDGGENLVDRVLPLDGRINVGKTWHRHKKCIPFRAYTQSGRHQSSGAGRKPSPAMRPRHSMPPPAGVFDGARRFQPHKMERRLDFPSRTTRPCAEPGGTMEYLTMSMPSFPPHGADLTREEALTMIIASIAMEELALSHIINAEGEKLQYILGTLPGAKTCATPQDVLEVNKSVASLLDVVAQNQMLLKSKLEKVLGACPPLTPPCPPPKPCPPEPPICGPCPPPPTYGPEICPPSGCLGKEGKRALHLVERQPGFLWSPGCRLPWRQQAQCGEYIRWNECNPTQIRLDLRAAYAIRCTLSVYAMPPAKGEGYICLRQTPCGSFTDAPPLRFSLERMAGSLQTLQYAAVIYPCANVTGPAELSLVLDTRNALCVERASMDVVEL